MNTQELIYGFIQFAFGEMQTEGWVARRSDYRLQQHISDPYVDERGQRSFPVTMETRYNGDLEMALIHFFCNEISSFGWFDAYCFYQRPELDTRDEDYYYYWEFNEVLREWIESDHRIGDESVDVADALKDILGLDFCLK
jgi:hypothetical protein